MQPGPAEWTVRDSPVRPIFPVWFEKTVYKYACASRGRRRRRGRPPMLILELGVWLIPFTLVLVPCRRLVLLVSTLRRILDGVVASGSTSPAIWMRLARVNSMALVVWGVGGPRRTAEILFLWVRVVICCCLVCDIVRVRVRLLAPFQSPSFTPPPCLLKCFKELFFFFFGWSLCLKLLEFMSSFWFQISSRFSRIFFWDQ